MTDPTPAQAAMKMIEEFATAVAALTGVKKQLTDQGWSELAAEQVVVEFLRRGEGS